MTPFALLLTALLFGGMTLFSFGFAAVLFKSFDAPTARRGIRGAFPYYYLWVIGNASLAGAVALAVNTMAGAMLIAIALTTIYARQVLMAQINTASDAGDTGAFKRLHGISVVLQLIQIGAAGWALMLLG